jgi:hypothetical protein
VSKGVAVLGVILLALAPALEQSRPAVARVVSIWGLVATSLVVWVLAPTAVVAPTQKDPLRVVCGMLGWALFALASTAPALARDETTAADSRPPASRALKPRGDSGRVDTVILAAGTLLAALLQGFGWQAEEPARAVLARMVSVVAGLVLLSASASVVVLRHTPHRALPTGKRARRAALPLVLFGLWATAGAVYALTVRR